MCKILVTGGAGFIGSHLCESLVADGHEVRALDCFDDFYDPAVKERNLQALAGEPRFSLIRGDIRDPHSLERALSCDVDAVIHLAARAGVRPSIEQPLLYEDVNVKGTLHILEAMRRRPQCKLIFGSSSSVYGNNAKVPFREDDRVDDPISPYAATKRAGELLCRAYHHLFGSPVTCLRFFTVYGPRQRPDLAIYKFVERIEAGLPIPVFGDGSMQRDFTYVADIIQGIKQALAKCAGFKIYNLGRSEPITLAALISAIERSLQKRAVIDRRPLQPGDVDHTFADVTLARSELGYAPRVSIQEGLAHFVRWFRETRPLSQAGTKQPRS